MRVLQLISSLTLVLSAVSVGWAAEDKEVPKPPDRENKIRVLIFTGGHDFDREPFFAMFAGHPDITWKEAVYPGAQQWFSEEKADAFDVMVWYDMWQEITDESKSNLVSLLKRGKPLVALHHSAASFNEWPEAIKIVGGRYNIKPRDGHPGSTYKHDQLMKVKIADPSHPITRFVSDFEILDETYGQLQLLPGVKPLLRTGNPASSEVISWTHAYGNSPVTYIQLGHDALSYASPAYRRLVIQAIRYGAGRLPDPSEEGFVPLFNGKNLDGWTVMGDPKGFVVKDGVIRSDLPYKGQWMRTNRTYENFILRVEWRVSRLGNSGVFVRSQEQGHPWITGSEVQITNTYRDDAHCTGSLYGTVAVDPRPDEEPDVWHECEIQCNGSRYKVFADGLPVVDVDARKVPELGAKPLVGYIGLQDNHSEKGYVEYRNIRVKELEKMDQQGGWQLGTQAYTFNRFTFFEAVDKAKELGLKYIEAYPGQSISAEFKNVRIGHDMPSKLQNIVQAKLDEAGVKLVNYGVITPKANEEELRQIFDFCKAMGIETITAEPAKDAFDLLDKLTQEYEINLAIHNHPKPSPYWNPETVLEVIKGRNPRIGVCADTGHWLRSNLDPVECLKKLEGRIISLHFKDLNKKGAGAHDVPWGTGVGDVKAQLAELLRQGFAGVFSIEYEHNWENSMPDIAKCVEYFHQVADELGQTIE